MEIQLLNSKDLELNFIIKDINEVMANTLRRAMITEIPIMAIDEINFIKNDSALYDEVIAHRLGLIPLITDLKSYNLKEKCSCKDEGCAKCQLNLTLTIQGPCTVYASDIKSQDPKVKPVFDKMPIVELVKDQKLELEAVAKLGLGKEHSKFSPALVIYQGYPEFVISKDSNIEECNKQIENVKIVDNKLEIIDVLKWNEAMEEICEKNNVKVERSKKDFIFYIESFGQLKPRDVVLEGIKAFNDKLDDFSKSLKKLK